MSGPSSPVPDPLTGSEPATESPPVPWVLTRRGPLAAPHPWIYRRMLKETSPGLADGDEVQVLLGDGTPAGRGFYNGRSMIAVRVLSRDADRPLDAGFFRERIGRAVALRRETLNLERSTDSFRVIHAEGDGLSGLIVDRHASVLVIEYFSLAMQRRHGLIRDLLQESFPGSEVVWRVDVDIARREGIPPAPEAPDREVEIRENKMRYLVRPGAGHKTGFFCDQRENRERFAGLVRGRKVLDACCYTGAFGIAARTAGKARQVVGVDLDENALAVAKRNGALNRAEIEWIHADAFRYLRAQRDAVDPFEAVVLDPPKWAPSREQIPRARERYRDLGLAGIRALRHGGLLLACSCSGLISQEDFLSLLRSAAAQAGRQLQVFAVEGAAPDHPFSIHCPESRYLTAVYAWVGEK